VTVGGVALDPAKTYRVASNDFMARGGDGYGMLAGSSAITSDSGDQLIAQAVMDYVAKLKTVDAVIDGRMVVD
jgi:2',3'-cyclic-nucleotide 2'-phosphodiesterase (5'-nucleotidase family)